MSQMTPDQAVSQIAAEEFATQISALTRRLAVERVRVLQLEQEVTRLQGEVARLTPAADEAGPENEEHREDH